MTPESVLKTPAGLLSVTVDFTSELLNQNTSLASYSVDIPADLTVVDSSNTSTRVTLEIKGGTVGAVYPVKVLGVANKAGMRVSEEFTVRVVSSLSEETLAPQVPGRPRNVRATVAGQTVTIAFDPPTDLGFPAQVTYQVSISQTIAPQIVTASPAVFSGVPFGTYNEAFVVAQNASGWGDYTLSAPIVVGDVVPVFSADPSFSGQAMPGFTLTGIPGTFTDGAQGVTTLQLETAVGSGAYTTLPSLTIAVTDAHKGRRFKLTTSRTYNAGTQQVSKEVIALVPAIILAAVTAPAIGALNLNALVTWSGGSYNTTPDSVTPRLYRTPFGGQEAEVSTTYTLTAVDFNAVFRVVETAVKAGQPAITNPSASATFTVQAQAEPLQSVSAVPNHAAGTVTYTMTPKAGQFPTQYLFGDVGGTKSTTAASVVTVSHATGTFTPEAIAVVGTAMSPAIQGPQYTLYAPMIVTGDPSITGQPVVSATLGVLLPGSSGVVSTAYQWTRNGSDIAGATASTYVPTQTGSYAVRVSFTGGDGTTIDRTATAVTVVAAPVDVPGRVTGLTIMPNNAGPGVVISWTAPTTGATASDYSVQIKRVGGSTPTATTTSTSLIVTDPFVNETLNVTVSARNSLGNAGDPETVQLKFWDGIGGVIRLSSGPNYNIIKLTQADIDHLILILSAVYVSAGTVQIRDQNGAVLLTATENYTNEYVSTTGLTALYVTATGGTLWQCQLNVWAIGIAVDGRWSITSNRVASTVSVTQVPSAFNMGAIVRRYGIDVFNNQPATNVPTTVGDWQTPPAQRTSSLTMAVPAEALGKYIAPRAWYYDPILDKYVGSTLVGILDGSSGAMYWTGPIAAAGTGLTATISNTTAMTGSTPGVMVRLSDIEGASAAAGTTYTITTRTDASSTGGIGVWELTAAQLTAYQAGTYAIPQDMDFDIPPTQVVGTEYPLGPFSSETVALVLGPIGSGTYSYTLALGGAVAAPASETGVFFDDGQGLFFNDGQGIYFETTP